jgi:hypothetical protein
MGDRIVPATRARSKGAQRVCEHCHRPVFTLAPVDSGEHFYCSLACRYGSQTLEEVAAELNAWRGSDDEEEDDDD